MVKMKRIRNLILLTFFFLTLSIQIVQAQFQITTFNERKQAWLNRNGAMLDGGFDTRVHFGRPYLFAWLENNSYISNNHPQLGSFHDQLKGMLDVRGNAGCRTGLHISRIFYQYEDVLKSSSYPYPDDWEHIKSLLSFDASDDNHLNTRCWKKSTQPQRTITAFLHTLEYDRDATVLWPTGTFDDIQFISSYSGKSYTPGNRYNTFELSRDWLFHALEIWAKQGSSELDGNYTSLAIHSLLLLHDFSARPLDRLGGGADPDGIEMKKRANMVLDLLLLDQVMDFSANHHGGAFGRVYRYNITHALMRSLYYAYFGVDKGGTMDDGDAYVSSYRLPELIEDLGTLWDESSSYGHIHKENNLVGSDPQYGKWTYVTKYFNLGGGGPSGDGWQLAIYSEDTNGDRTGQPFRLWIDGSPSSADPDESLNEYTTMGSGNMYQYRNSALFKFWDDPHVHVCLLGNSFDDGHEQLMSASQYTHDYFINPGWKFFREANVAIALNLDADRFGAMEVVILDPNANSDHCYASFEDFKNAVKNNCELTENYFKTSRGNIIEADLNGGRINGQPIWQFPFKRMETVDYQGRNLISWNNNVMTITKNNQSMVYDFNNWECSDINGSGDFIAPAPPANIAIFPSDSP